MFKFCGEILTFLDKAVEEANSVKWIHFYFFVIIDINTVLQFLSMFLAFGIFPETCPTFVSLVIHAFCSYEIKKIFIYSKLSKIMELIYFPSFGSRKWFWTNDSIVVYFDFLIFFFCSMFVTAPRMLLLLRHNKHDHTSIRMTSEHPRCCSKLFNDDQTNTVGVELF